jgi:hypothetical protein
MEFVRWLVIECRFLQKEQKGKPLFCSEHGQVAGNLKYVDEISGSLKMEFLNT